MTKLTLEIGRRGSEKVASFAEASALYADVRDGSGEGASTFPWGRLLDGSTVVAKISYNGRVWKLNPESREYDALVYCPGSADQDEGRPEVFNEGRESVWGQPKSNPYVTGTVAHVVFERGAEYARSCSIKRA